MLDQPVTKQKRETYLKALRRIEVCREQQATKLDLEGLGLTELPSEVGQLTQLTSLNVRNNELSTLPPEIGQLTMLTSLDVSINVLATLPPEIGQLTALTSLDARTNRLSALPIEIGRLTALTELHVGGNFLSAVPAEIGNLTSLLQLALSDNELTVFAAEILQLTALQSLDLDSNRLTSVPVGISRLTTLRTLRLGGNPFGTFPAVIFQLLQLEHLSLSGANLSSLPAEIGQLRRLEFLYLDRNGLTSLPSHIGELTALRTLSLDHNKLRTLPPTIGRLTSLITLYLVDTDLSSLPAEICELQALKRLYLHENARLGIPESILGPPFSQHDTTPARAQDILTFYFAQHEAAAAGTLRPLNEIKVMLVGRGGAGKTSLRRFFMGAPHDEGEKETPGIALDTVALGNITVRLWDFAGQEITHALHQFFLTEGCIYILVLDPRSNTEMQDAEYWLGLLKRYAAGAPVLVALNRQDAREGGYDVDRYVLMERFPFIHSFTPTNCDGRRGCAELAQRLQDAVGSLSPTEPPHLQVPKAWLNVMRDCDGEARDVPETGGKKLMRWLRLAGHAVPAVSARQHMTLQEFREICMKHGETVPAKQESLARLLHKLGAILHFVDEPRLRDTAVLNPHWVTDGVYRLLRFKDRPRSDGTLMLSEALEALPGETEETARFFLRLMERFEMCFPLDEEECGKQPTKWLIPGALAEFQPVGVTADWQKTGGVRLRYVYDPLPEGLLPRFIVMTHLLSEGNPRWRNGVVLHDGQAAALVRRGEKRNHVEVTAFGPEADRLRLLEIIQGNLERIHLDLPEPKPTAELELSGLPGVFRAVADLEAAELGKQQVAVETKQGTALVEPTRQLNQASAPEARGDARVPLNAFLSYSHEDKKAKAIFQQNLTVMTKKKLITQWHDGLIEPGKRWRDEIDENLEKMDIFIALLTNAFLVSDFIERVELTAARAKLASKDRDFLFVLVLVDDISLTGLDLAEYQILVPGGKAVSRHASRKEGFNAAQKELERLIRQRQGSITQSEVGQFRPGMKYPSELEAKDGITMLAHSDHFIGDKHTKDGSVPMREKYGLAAQTLDNCMNMIRQQIPGERKDLLEELTRQVQQLMASLPADKQSQAPHVAENVEMLIKQAISATPNRKWYALSREELLESVAEAEDCDASLAGTLKKLDKVVWGATQT